MMKRSIIASWTPVLMRAMSLQLFCGFLQVLVAPLWNSLEQQGRSTPFARAHLVSFSSTQHVELLPKERLYWE